MVSFRPRMGYVPRLAGVSEGGPGDDLYQGAIDLETDPSPPIGGTLASQTRRGSPIAQDVGGEKGQLCRGLHQNRILTTI